MRTAHDRQAACVRGRQSAGARHVRGRGAGARRGSGRPAVRRALRQAARPDDRGDRPRPRRRLHRQHHSMAPARQPHADAAGEPDLPALHSAPDRARQSGYPRLPRRAGLADPARRQGRHQAHARALVRVPHRHARNPRHRDLPSGLSVALAAGEALRLARFRRDQKGAGREPEALSKGTVCCLCE